MEKIYIHNIYIYEYNDVIELKTSRAKIIFTSLITTIYTCIKKLKLFWNKYVVMYKLYLYFETLCI